MMKKWVKKGYPAPRSKVIYYVLQFTWGLPLNILGGLMYIALKIAGKNHCKFGRNFEILLPKANFGLSMGIFAIAPDNSHFTSTSVHEHGHAIQNIIFGPATMFVIFIPSIIRFWYRNFMQNVVGIRLNTTYDDAWFEGSATATGRRFMEEKE